MSRSDYDFSFCAAFSTTHFQGFSGRSQTSTFYLLLVDDTNHLTRLFGRSKCLCPNHIYPSLVMTPWSLLRVTVNTLEFQRGVFRSFAALSAFKSHFFFSLSFVPSSYLRLWNMCTNMTLLSIADLSGYSPILRSQPIELSFIFTSASIPLDHPRSIRDQAKVFVV